MLADSSLPNLQLITKELLSMHHTPDPSLSKEFDVRLDKGFSGSYFKGPFPMTYSLQMTSNS
jgi:hypothetical protein